MKDIKTQWPWLPYVAPMVLFLVLTSLESSLPGAGESTVSPWYPLFYAFKIILVIACLVFFRSTWADLRPMPKAAGTAVAIALGLLVIVVWVGLDGHYPSLGDLVKRVAPWMGRDAGSASLGRRIGFDPFGLTPLGAWSFLAVRFLGLVVVVPLMEELFWRSFLVRWLIDLDFERVPLGKMTGMAAALTSVAFALAHPEWLPALLTGLAWAGLLAWTKSVSACLMSHAVANLALGAYVLITGEWKYL